MTTISIALATYNGERFLAEQLASLASQTRLPDELIVSDDCSTDTTTQLIDDFSRVAPFRVILLPKTKQLGYRANFMRCARHCSSELIAFCDQDDIWDPNKLEVMSSHFSDQDIDFAFHTFRLIDQDGCKLPFHGETERFKQIDEFTLVFGLTQVFRSTLLQFTDYWQLSLDPEYPEERLAHDQWFYLLASKLGRTVFIDQALLSYRQHESNTVGIWNGADLNAKQPQRIPKNVSELQHKRNLMKKYLGGRVAAIDNRLQIFQLISQNHNEFKDREIMMISEYKKMYDFFSHRADIFCEKWTKSASAFFQACKCGTYPFSHRGLKDCMLDLLIGVTGSIILKGLKGKPT